MRAQYRQKFVVIVDTTLQHFEKHVIALCNHEYYCHQNVLNTAGEVQIKALSQHAQLNYETDAALLYIIK